MQRVTIEIDERVEGYLRDLSQRDGRNWALDRAAVVVLQVAIEDRLDRERGLLRDHAGPSLLAACTAVESELSLASSH